jgi:hypothetical protein
VTPVRPVSRRRPGDDPADELYAAPLRDFVATRETIARRMRDEGKNAAATAIKALPKPKATVWAINRVARTAPKAVKQVLGAFDVLKAAQLRAPAKMGAAASTFREAIEAVVHLAIAALKESGMTTTLDTHRRIANTLRGAAATARGPLVDGRLVDEITPGGFDLFEGATPRGHRPRLRVVRETPAPPPRDDLARRRAAQLEQEAADRERAAQSAGAAVQEARERLRELEGRARAASRTATKSRGAAERARGRVEKKRPPR